MKVTIFILIIGSEYCGTSCFIFRETFYDIFESVTNLLVLSRWFLLKHKVLKMLLHDKVLKHHPFATSLPVKQVPSKIGQKSNSCYIATCNVHCLERHLVLQIITRAAKSIFMPLKFTALVNNRRSQIVNQRLQFLLPSIIIATYHNLQTSLFEPAEGNLYFLRVPSGWLTQAKNINAGYICLLQSSHVIKKHNNLSQD